MITKRKTAVTWPVIMALLLHCASIQAQQVLEYTRAAAGGASVGMTYWYTDSYTNAGGCRNSVEFLPAGFDFNDDLVKYPLLIFLPGRNESINPFDYTNGGNKPEFEKAPTLLSGSGYSIFTYTWPSIIKVQRLPLPNYLLTYYAPKDVTGPGGELFSFIVVTIQCGQFDPITDYEAFIRGYIFDKYKDKIDPGRIYITGLSLGGGKTMEILANPANANLIAAVAPVATGTECPYTPEYISTPGTLGPSGVPPVWTPCADQSGFTSIINNIIDRPQLGVFFNHNLADRSNAPVKISQFFFNALNNIEPGRAQGFFNNFTPSDPFDPAHDAWSRAYDPFVTDYNGQNIYRWFLNYQSNNALLPLPLVLRQFTANLANNMAATLKWSTSLEKNTSHFEIERSTDGTRFSQIGKLNAAGNANQERTYSFVDNIMGLEEVYYRLKMVDRDGRFEYSSTRKLSLANRGLQFSISPNPFHSQVDLTIEGQSRGMMQVSLYDQTGRLVMEETIRKEQQTFTRKYDLKLANGIYLFKVKGDNIDFTSRVIKQ